MNSPGHGSTPPPVFEALYARDRDPWDFETSAYERGKYRETLAALPSRRFRSGLEIGCSIGVLTRLLADRCAALLAIDVAEAALAEARRKCRDVPHVEFRRAIIPAEWPDGTFNLVVMSEILYFLDADDIERTARRAIASLTAGGVVMLVNYLGPTDTICDGDAAAEIFLQTAAGERHPLRLALQRRRTRYRLDLLSDGG